MSAPEQADWTVARLLAWTQDFLRRQGLESPRLCAELLLAHALGCERIRLYTAPDQVPAEPVRTRYRELVKEAATGRPIAYLIGHKDFYSLSFKVTPDVLIPRPETEILVERTIALARKRPDGALRVLDLGTGSGCIAVSLARHLPAARVFASDVSDAALHVARGNAARHGVAERIEFRHGDLCAPWRGPGGAAETFDVIVSNPPYVATEHAPVDEHVRKFEPPGALFAGPEGLDMIRRILREAPAHVAPGGQLLMEVAYDQAAKLRGRLLDVWQEVTTYRDGAGYERVLHLQRAAAACAVA